MRFIFILSFFIFSATAFIPKPEFIFSRLDRYQGDGWYSISQTVSFKEVSSSSYFTKFKETWWRGPESLFVRVKNSAYPELYIELSYSGGQKAWIDSKGKRVYKSGNFIEPYFSSSDGRPEWFSKIESATLSRAQGVVNYLIGKADQKVWIEQDEFVIRQIQLLSNVFLEVLSFMPTSRSLRFPKSRLFKSPNYEVSIETNKVTSLARAPSLELKKNQWIFPNTESRVQLMKQFYQDIR